MGQTPSDITTIYTREQVQAHNSRNDCWVIIDQTIYDLTTFLPKHPGGSKSILAYAGYDATQAFYRVHRTSQNILESLKNLQVGRLTQTLQLVLPKD